MTTSFDKLLQMDLYTDAAVKVAHEKGYKFNRIIAWFNPYKNRIDVIFHRNENRKILGINFAPLPTFTDEVAKNLENIDILLDMEIL